MADGLDDGPQVVLCKQRTSETARRKKRKFPQESIPDSASVEEPMQSLPNEDNISFPALIAIYGALNFIQSQQYHIEFTFPYSPGFDIRNDDICRYGISLEQESKLRELEIRRLVTAIRTDISHSPFGSLADELWRPDDAGFESLSRLADEINMNIATCNFDNSFLRLRLDEHGRRCAFPGDERDILEGYQNRLHSDSTADASSTKTKDTAERTRRCYCAMIDYVTAVAARCACYDVSDEGWYSRVVASLATCAAKIKFLAIDSLHFAQQSLTMNEDSKYHPEGLRVKGTVDNEAKLNQSYKMSSWALDIISSVFRQLDTQSMPEFLRDAHNISTVVYRTGWRDVPILLSQNPCGDISGTSARPALGMIQGAIHTLHQVAGTIKLVKFLEHPDTSMSIRRISFQLDTRLHYFAPAKSIYGGPMEGYIDNLFDFISVIVPLLLMEPKHLLQLNHVSDFVAGTSSTSIYRSPTHISIANFPSLSVFVDWRLRPDLAPEKGLTGTRFQPMSRFLVFEDANWQDVDETRSTIKISSAHTWVFEEKSIVVSRRFFVTMTMTTCGTLVVGGILAAFLVGERIPGVDPFNIATFTWVLAAFVILIAKSLSVREWPWRDFLRGEVACRSVSELHTVTGVDEQEILEYLLAKEAYTILTTRGPFNVLFSRKRDDGFSIDVKMKLRTLISSGIAVFGVATNIGPALVCLDFRRGVEGRTSINHSDGVREGECLFGCFDFPEAIYDDSDIPLQKLPESMTWTRVLGLYDRENKRFR